MIRIEQGNAAPHPGGSAAVRAVLLAGLLLASNVQAQAPPDGPAVAYEQMVVAANPHATAAGIEILREGGSAIDAAIAVQLVLSMVEPQSSGIGGGAFLLHLDAGADAPEVVAYEGRETAPAAATERLFVGGNGEPRPYPEIGWGGLPVGVPGVMRMLEMAHADHGELPWARLFEPAIELAEAGFEISPRLYFLLERYEGVARSESFLAHYYDADGTALETGHRLVNPEYAETLRVLARDGADAMYSGALAGRIVEAVANNSIGAGLLSLEDLRSYEAHESGPLCSSYRRWRVCGPRLPSSGGIAVQQILGLAEPFDLSGGGADPVPAIHVLAEASRLAFADRNFFLADPAFVDVPVAALLSPGYLTERAAMIRLDRTMDAVAPGEPVPAAAWNFAPSGPNALSSTSHLSIADRRGNAVSMTTSVQSAFGSQLLVGGFLLNNQLTDFSFVPERNGRPVANRPEGGKRPLSSMSPTFVFDGEDRLRMIVGSPGGTRIIGFVVQAIVGVLDFGLDIQEAVAAPHFVARFDPLELEERTGLLEHRAALEALGHDVRVSNLNSGLHGIWIDYTESGRILYGGVDPRREGAAAGD